MDVLRWVTRRRWVVDGIGKSRAKDLEMQADDDKTFDLRKSSGKKGLAEIDE